MSFRNSIKRRMIKWPKKIKFHIFRFRPTFSMLSRKVVSLQKCKKHLCCNLFWVSQKYLYFDWAIIGKIAAHSADGMFSWYKYLIVNLVFSPPRFLEWEFFSDCAFS